jgi:hypothetical protein
MRPPLNVLLIGLGNVGYLYDLKSENTLLTHFYSLLRLAKLFNVNLSTVEVDAKRRANFTLTNPDIPVYANLREIEELNKCWDLLVVAVPTELTATVLSDIHECVRFHHLIVEKPVASSLEQFMRIPTGFLDDQRVRVGFPRRTLPSTKFLIDAFQNFGSGQEWNIELAFEGDVLNIASHFLDLIEVLMNVKLRYHVAQNEKVISLIGETCDKRVKLRAVQSGVTNLENTAIQFNGPFNLSYSKSGREVISPDLNIFEFKDEIRTMIGYEAFHYLCWASGACETLLPTISNSIIPRLLSPDLGK